jgi:two-component system sensor histidine kinase ResE
MDSGIAEFKREGVNLERLLQGVAEKFTPQARQAQVNLQVDIGPLASFIGDEDRLNQVFTNLVDNALKITPENGSVILRARQVDGMVEVSVSDTGPGIPPQELSRIFERFY